jgi:hypothetical protein
VRETLLLLLEVMLLDPSKLTHGSCFTRMVNFLQSKSTAQGRAGTSTAVAGLAAATAAAAAAADDVLQPVLQHLAPMMLAEAAEQQCTSSDTASTAAPSQAAQALRRAALTADTAGTSRSTAEVPAAAMRVRPHSFSDLVERLVITGEGLLTLGRQQRHCCCCPAANTLTRNCEHSMHTGAQCAMLYASPVLHGWLGYCSMSNVNKIRSVCTCGHWLRQSLTLVATPLRYRTATSC